jgi:hypothetical protein
MRVNAPTAKPITPLVYSRTPGLKPLMALPRDAGLKAGSSTAMETANYGDPGAKRAKVLAPQRRAESWLFHGEGNSN